MLVFAERGKPEYPEKNLSEQRREPTTNSTHIWRRVRESNPGHIGGRRVLSPLRHPCSPVAPIPSHHGPSPLLFSFTVEYVSWFGIGWWVEEKKILKISMLGILQRTQSGHKISVTENVMVDVKEVFWKWQKFRSVGQSRREKNNGLIKRTKIVGKKSLFKTGYPKNNGEIRLKKSQEFHFLRLKEILKLSCSPWEPAN